MSKEVRNIIIGLIVLTYLILCLLSFEVKLSIGGDDASYIVRANRLLKYNDFPTYQGPLYPIFLLPFVALFGIEIVKLKLLSVVLAVGFILTFFFSFKDRVKDFTLIISMIFIATNSYFIYYASQTYNEIFHLFIQGIFFFSFFKVLDFLENNPELSKTHYKRFALLAFLALLVSLSKSIGVVMAGSVVVFFVLRKEFKYAATFGGMFAGMYLVYNLIRDWIWGVAGYGNSQLEILMHKDPYDYSKGKEDFFGFLTRIYENMHIYISKHFLRILHIRPHEANSEYESLTYLILAVFGLSFYFSWKRNKYIFFSNIFIFSTLLATFLVLQTRWDSDRIILIVVPYMFLSLTYVIWELSRLIKFRPMRLLVLASLVIVLIYNLQSALSKVDIVTMRKNLMGDKYTGYTDDWVNYLKMSEWTTKNLPKGSYVAVRKQTMSIIYSGGHDFQSIARIPSRDPDTLITKLKDAGVTHIVIASLRRNPKVKTEYVINTVKRYAAIIEKKYPGTFRLVYKEGVSEPAMLYEIHYPY